MVSMSELFFNIRSVLGTEKKSHRRKNAERFRSSAIEQLDTRVLLAATYADDHVILSLQPNTDVAAIRGMYPGSEIRPLGDYGLHLVTLPASIPAIDTISRYEHTQGVNFAELDWVVTREAIPNDPRFPEQWNLKNVGQTVAGQAGIAGADVDADPAWDLHTGSGSVIVAIVDDGIDYNHPDLAANMWTNPGEIAGNGVDDDNNGFIDDIRGYDFGSLDSDPMPDPGDAHGTHVAGIVGAVGNNGLGISGVDWNVKLMAVKIFGNAGNFVSTIVGALNYAVDNGALVSNHSYNTGTGGPILAHQAAIVNAQSKGHVFVSSAGNTTGDNDVIDHYPSDYPFDNVIAVAATDNQDAKAGFSNFGVTTVHLGAPGVDVLSTIPGAAYGLNSGTSMASPHVAGAVALLMSFRPDLNYQDILGAMYRGTDKIPSLQGITITGGRLNLKNAIDELPALPDPTPGIPSMLAPIGTIPQATPQFFWTSAQNASQYELEVDDVSRGRAAFYVRTATSTSHVAAYQFGEGDYRARVRTITAKGLISAWSNYADFTIDVPAPAKPRILRPNGDITDSFPTFEWTSDVNSRTYTLWVNSVTTQQRIIYRTAYAGTTYVHFDPLPDGMYRAWVKAFNTVGESSAWSDFVEFTIDAPIPVAPVITAPIPVTTSVNPRIIWTPVEAAAKYDLWVNNLTTGTAQYIRRENISRLTPYYDPPALPQGSYLAWVRAANGNNEFSPWSAGYSFTVDVLPPGTPKMLGPTGPIVNLTITTSNPTFKWTAVDRAVKYDLWVNNVTTGQFQIIREQNITGTEYLALNNLPQGNYRAWVRGINSANEVGEWSTVYVFTLDEPIPSIPVITAPVPNPAGSVENPNPTFLWTADFDAPFYEFRLDDVTLNKTSVIRVTNIQAKSYTIPNNQRLAEHTYQALVRGINNSGEKSDWSVAYRVRIDVPNPTTPSIIAPSGTSKDTTPTFQWTHDPAAFRYEILVRDLERNESIVLQVKTFAVDPTGKIAFYTLPDSQALRPGTYRFWIRAFNSIGTASSWSNSKTFVISASLDLKDLKLVEPEKLRSIEEFYAATEFVVEPESEPAAMLTASASATTMAVPEPVLPVSDIAMPVAVIEELMESLADPASAASAMMSGSLFNDSAVESRTNTTSTTAASILALALMPVRRKRREA